MRATPGTTGFRASVVHLPPERNESRQGTRMRALNSKGAGPSLPCPYPSRTERPRAAASDKDGTSPCAPMGGGVQTALDGAPGFDLPGPAELGGGSSGLTNSRSGRAARRLFRRGRAPDNREAGATPARPPPLYPGTKARSPLGASPGRFARGRSGSQETCCVEADRGLRGWSRRRLRPRPRARRPRSLLSPRQPRPAADRASRSVDPNGAR
jgi:hypothetical protein